MDKSRLNILETKGPEAVLLEIASGQHGHPGSELRDETEAWLRSKQVVAEREAASKRDAREEETLFIAREANDIARKDRYIAIAAMTIAAIAAREDIGSFIKWILQALRP